MSAKHTAPPAAGFVGETDTQHETNREWNHEGSHESLLEVWYEDLQDMSCAGHEYY